MRGQEPLYGAWGPRRTEFIRASGASDVVVTKDLFTPLSVIVEVRMPASMSEQRRDALALQSRAMLPAQAA